MAGKKRTTHECIWCKEPVPLSHLACNRHWFALPPGLRDQLMAAKKYGRINRCHPTDQFLRLRNQASECIAQASANSTPKERNEYAEIK